MLKDFIDLQLFSEEGSIVDDVAEDAVVDDVAEDVVVDDVVDGESTTVETDTPEVPETPTTYDIDGESYTLEQLREFKQGHLRQDDYTRKTQELARMREELSDVAELRDYLASNPQLIEAMNQMDIDPNIQDKAMQYNPVMQRLNALESQIAEKELDSELSRLSSKYSDFNDVAVLEKATELGISDLEFVYLGMRGDSNMDAEKIKTEAVAQAKAEIMKEIKANKNITQTLVDNSSTTVEPDVVELSATELRVAEGLGLSAEDYAKWK